MKPIHLIILVALSLAFATCTDSGDILAPEIQQLFGSWQWVKSIGGFGGETRTPESTGMTIVVEFQPHEIVTFYANGDLVRRIGYHVQKENQSYYIRYDAEDMISQSISYRGLDTLQLNDECCDGYMSTYARIAK